MRKNAADRLLALIAAKKNPTVVGLDPVWERIPEEIKESVAAEVGKDPIRTVTRSFLLFNKRIIDAVKEIVPAVKPQFAFYEQYGSAGIEALEETVRSEERRVGKECRAGRGREDGEKKEEVC